MIENFGAKTNFAGKMRKKTIRHGRLKMASESHVASEGGADRRIGVH